METLRRNIFLTTEIKIKPPLQWRKLNHSLKTFGFRWARFWSARSSHGEYTITSIIHQLTLQAAAVVKDVKTGLTAVALSAKANRRLFVGFAFVGVIAPLAGCSHLLFDKHVVDRGWYHLNNFYLLLLLGPFITGTLICLGIYHLFPVGTKRAYTLALPMGYFIGKIIWLYQVKSNDEFYQITPINIILIGILISAVILFLNEWLAWRWAHRTRAFDARLDGLNNIVDEESISDAKFRSMFKTVYQQKKNFPKEY